MPSTTPVNPPPHPHHLFAPFGWLDFPLVPPIHAVSLIFCAALDRLTDGMTQLLWSFLPSATSRSLPARVVLPCYHFLLRIFSRRLRVCPISFWVLPAGFFHHPDIMRSAALFLSPRLSPHLLPRLRSPARHMYSNWFNRRSQFQWRAPSTVTGTHNHPRSNAINALSHPTLPNPSCK